MTGCEVDSRYVRSPPWPPHCYILPEHHNTFHNAASALNAASGCNIISLLLRFSPHPACGLEGRTHKSWPQFCLLSQPHPIPRDMWPTKSKVFLIMHAGTLVLHHWLPSETREGGIERKKSARRCSGCDPRYHKGVWLNKMLGYTCSNTTDDRSN